MMLPCWLSRVCHALSAQHAKYGNSKLQAWQLASTHNFANTVITVSCTCCKSGMLNPFACLHHATEVGNVLLLATSFDEIQRTLH